MVYIHYYETGLFRRDPMQTRKIDMNLSSFTKIVKFTIVYFFKHLPLFAILFFQSNVQEIIAIHYEIYDVYYDNSNIIDCSPV